MSASKAILMLILLLAGGYYLYSEQPTNLVEEGIKPEVLFPDFDENSIAGFSVESPDGKVEIQRNGEDWICVAVENAKIDAKVVTDWLYGISSLQSHNALDVESVGDRLADFGLEEPELKVAVTTSSVSEELYFGNRHPLSGRRYLLLPKRKQIAMVDESSAEKLDKTLYDFRDKQPYLGINKDIDSLTVAAKAVEPINFLKEEKRWFFKSGDTKVLAEDDLLERFIKTLAELPVLKFHPYTEESAKSFGLEEPEVAFGLGGKSFRVGKNGGNFYLWQEGSSWVHEYLKPFFRLLSEPNYYFRDKTPFDEVPLDQLIGVRVRSFKELGKEYSIAQIKRAEFGKVWAITDGMKKAQVMDKDKAVAWLKELLGIRVLSYSLPGSRSLKVSGEPEKSFDILFVDKDISKSYHLVVSGRVSDAKNKDAELKDDAPRYGTVRSGDGSETVPVLISGAAWLNLNKEMKDFFPEETESKGE